VAPLTWPRRATGAPAKDKTMDRDRILLTPGPLTTTLRTKVAMLRDWGSWDADFIALTARVRQALLAIACAKESHVLVPLQGSGTFSVEAAVATLVPPTERGGHVLVLDNGAYCKRAARVTTMMGRRLSVLTFAEDEPVSAAVLDRHLDQDRSISHVVVVHCETGTGVLNPLEEVAAVCERRGVGLIVDAMSTFGALPIDARRIRFDALIAASGKCLEGVPGMGFVLLRRDIVERCAGNSASLALDLHDQHQYLEKTGQWRFTPPTHVLAALAEAINQFQEEGGQPARLARYTDNAQCLIKGLSALGLSRFLRAEIQAPIIVTWHAPADPAYDFKRFYDAVKQRGFLLYPGKLTQVETFRVGCIGAIGAIEMRQAVAAVGDAMAALGLRGPGAPI
jgi:2-aminoethylphosphonate-pyruvate transaminase